MSIENSLDRLAAAMERNSHDAAVAEIVRQRDEALSRVKQLERDSGCYMTQRNERFKQLESERHRTAALRGVIKRLKAVPRA